MISTVSKNKILIYLIIHLCSNMLVSCKFPDDDLKKIEICHSISELYVICVHSNTCVYVGITYQIVPYKARI
jgi:hypothetical protein